MEVKDFVDVIENGEEKILEHLNNKKVVYVGRINGEIIEIETFDSEEEFINQYVKNQIENDFDYHEFKTAEEAYLLNCNLAVIHHYEDVENWWSNERGLKGEIESNDIIRKQLLSYEEITKDINRSDFVDGFYSWDTLNFPYIKGENIDYEYLTYFHNEEDVMNSIEAKGSFQLYVK